jgi:two-component system sensor histidine kinase DesK
MVPFVAGTGGDAARRASLIAFAVLSLVLVAQVLDATSTGQPGQVAFVVALFIVPLLYAVAGIRRLLARRRWPVLAAQAALTYVPFAVFGGHWEQGASGLLAGLVLLMLPGQWSWPLAGVLLVADVVVRVGLHGLPWTPAWSAALWVVIVFVDDCLILFGLVRLADLVTELQAARGQLAELAVARERVQASEDLQDAVGDRLADIAAMAAVAQQALPGDPAGARAQIRAAGITARDAIARARSVTADHRMPPGREPPPAPAAGQGTGAAIAPRVAWAILIVELCGFGLQTLNNAYLSDLDRGAAAAIVASTAAGVGLQLYHSRWRPGGDRPRAWPLTLAIQVVLGYVPFMLRPVHFVGGLAAFAAGSFLLLVPGRWRWAGYAAVVASWSALYAVVPQAGLTPHPGPVDVLYVVAIWAGVGLLVYGLSWLAATASQLTTLRGELARMAALAERLRVARDVHDLLGLGLSAIALKTDLIGRLVGRDDARAAAEIAELGRICAHARADIRLVTAGSQHLPLDAELDAARDILTSAGVTVMAHLVAGPPWPAAADTVLAPVLREAVTNILRHSAATTCTIRATTANGALRLDIGNDGARNPTADGERAGQRAAGHGTGSGLGNLTARVEAAGGRLTIGRAGGRFDLHVQIPLDASATDPGYSQPAPAAMRTASTRLRAPSLVTAAAR